MQRQYKYHLSDYTRWNQRGHAEDWLLYPKNLGYRLSIDETSLSNGELYTILTNKAAKGKKGAIVAMIKGTKAEEIIAILQQIPLAQRRIVKEVTLDMSPTMRKIVKRTFPFAQLVIDRFHVQQLAFEAVQEIRKHYRWMTIDKENADMQQAKLQKLPYKPIIYENGDTTKQLLARSLYLLFKTPTRWSPSQKQRAEILFRLFPDIKEAYHLALQLGHIYHQKYEKEVARTKLAHWFNRLTEAGYPVFEKVRRTIEAHYKDILNYFDHRSTNASAESFNAKIKAFRAQFRGVFDIPFFLFRLTKLYA